MAHKLSLSEQDVEALTAQLIKKVQHLGKDDHSLSTYTLRPYKNLTPATYVHGQAPALVSLVLQLAGVTIEADEDPEDNGGKWSWHHALILGAVAIVVGVFVWNMAT